MGGGGGRKNKNKKMGCGGEVEEGDAGTLTSSRKDWVELYGCIK